MRRKHPNKEIESALRHAEEHAWVIELGGAHAWGKMYCPYDDETCRCGEFCINSIWSTPKNPQAHANALRRAVDKCERMKSEKEKERD